LRGVKGRRGREKDMNARFQIREGSYSSNALSREEADPWSDRVGREKKKRDRRKRE